MKIFTFLSCLFILTCFLLISCSDDDKEDPKDEYYILSISVEDGSDYHIDSVLVKLTYEEDDTIIIARSEYNNGNFLVFLPKFVEERYLKDATEVYSAEIFGNYGNGDHILVSDINARVSDPIIFYAYKNDKKVGAISTTERIYFKYANKPFIVLGDYYYLQYIDTMIQKFNLNFENGWNSCYNIAYYNDDDFLVGEEITWDSMNVKDLKCYYIEF